MVHSSFWGGDMEAFVLQANARGLLDDSIAILTCGESALDRFKDQAPNGTIIGGRGPFGAFAPDNALNKWFVKAYTDAYGMAPTYPATKMAQAILGLKAAADKAGGGNGTVPATDAIADAFKGSTFESVSGTVKMDRGDGHQALQSISYGTYKYDAKTGKAAIENVITFSGECVTPPDGTTSDAWIKAGFPGAKCN